MLPAVLTFKSEGETVEKTIPTYFLRSYVSTENLSPDAIRNRPLSRHTEKHTLPGVKEYVSFVSSSGSSVAASITYLSGDNVLVKQLHCIRSGAPTCLQQLMCLSRLFQDCYLPEKFPWNGRFYKSGYSGNGIKYILDKRFLFPCYGVLIPDLLWWN